MGYISNPESFNLILLDDEVRIDLKERITLNFSLIEDK